MKQFKSGFSLAEVLISLGIVSIIATLGFTLARRGVENAFNQYIYTGYKGISLAIADATNRGFHQAIEIDPENRFIRSLLNTLSIDLDDASFTAESVEFTAPNGISYRFIDKGIVQRSIGSDAFVARRVFVIVMSVPTKRERGRDRVRICLAYLPEDHYGGVLIPYQGDPSDRGEYSTDIPNIGDRKDLLPFFVDDGIRGRTIPNGGNFSYTKKQYYSINEALCRVHKPYTDIPTPSFFAGNGEVIVNCATAMNDQGVPYNDPSLELRGAIKVADPRKVY